MATGYRGVSPQARFENGLDTNARIQRRTLHPLGEAVSLSDSNNGRRLRRLGLSLVNEGHMEDNDSKKQPASRFVWSYPSIVHSFGTDDLTTKDRLHKALTKLCLANNHRGTRSGWEAGDTAGKGRGKGGSRPRNRMGGRDRDGSGDQDQDESTGVQTIAIVWSHI